MGFPALSQQYQANHPQVEQTKKILVEIIVPQPLTQSGLRVSRILCKRNSLLLTHPIVELDCKLV
jgi:hypothetical protein